MAKKKKPALEAEGTPQPPASEEQAVPEAEAAALDAQQACEPALAGEEAQVVQAETLEHAADEALAEAKAKQEEYLALAQRVQADFENFRRRNQNVRKEAYDDGARALVSALLPVVDNLERAIGAAQDSPDPKLREGVEMVYRQLCETFEKRGIHTIDRKGERFDPNLENAVMQGAAEEGEPGTVCEVLQKGYMLDDVVIRHAMVKVVPE